MGRIKLDRVWGLEKEGEKKKEKRRRRKEGEKRGKEKRERKEGEKRGREKRGCFQRSLCGTGSECC